MSVGAIIVLVIVCVLLAAAAALAGTAILRRMALRHRFGAEYDRLVREVGPRRAQAELADRRRRVAGLGIRPLSAEQRARYGRQWAAAQERFVDSPAQATEAAAELVVAIATDRGYPVDDHAQFLMDLSVHHARRLDGYRRARQTTKRAGAATEDLREALLGYRALFRELLGVTDSAAARPAVPAWANTRGGAVGGAGAAAATTAQAPKKG